MVCILLSTYNGESYLEEQLISLIYQKGIEIQICARDDGSTDGTTRILDAWQSQGLLKWYSGENKGPALSFIDLLKNAPEAEFYAFCDQDDVWLPDKLFAAVRKLKQYPDDVPNLYCSNLSVVNSHLSFMYFFHDKRFERFSKASALIDSWGAGCTMVFNIALRKMVLNNLPSTFVAMHDKWLLLCAIFTGNLYYDSESYILYRQHGKNVIGEKRSLRKWCKDKYLFFGKIKNRPIEKIALAFSASFYEYLSDDDSILLSVLCNYRTNVIQKIKFLFGYKDLHMKSLSLNINLKIKILLNAV